MDEKFRVATAIKYERENDVAPRVVAKGVGYVADAIMEKASEGQVPVYKDEKLSRQLYNLELGEEIPFELYNVVAEVLLYIARLDQEKQK